MKTTFPRSHTLVIALRFAALVTAAFPGFDSNAAEPSAAERMSVPGPEAQLLQRTVGQWRVVATFRPTADATPIVTKDLVAERRMLGLYLEEVMQPVGSPGAGGFRRVAYLTYSRVEGRWQYVSLDTRFPVGIMPAYSFGKGTSRELILQFEPLAFVGLGSEVEGRMIRSNLVITRPDEDHEIVRQYWITPDGSEREWLAVEYDYTRIR
jgi:hypothetical protein